MGRGKEKLTENFQPFRCSHCRNLVFINEEMGTKHRNHCTFCLWSKHVDRKPGDRKADCMGSMKPIGITLKAEGTDRFTGALKYGDIMIVHECADCGKFSINRIAADDSSQTIMQVFEQSVFLSDELRQRLESDGIMLTRLNDRSTIKERLYGKTLKYHLPSFKSALMVPKTSTMPFEVTACGNE